MSIYKPCDIRGHVAGELTPELYRRWGFTLGSWLDPTAKFVVGGDVRDSTPAFQEALIDGLCTAGVDTRSISASCPPRWSIMPRAALQAEGCAIVTGSHNPAELNGLKWLVGDQPPGPDEVERLRRAGRAAGRCESPGRPRSNPRPLDISFDYVAWLQETWVDALRAHRHVVLDPMHGCWAARARRYLNAIFPECLLSAIHDWSDPRVRGPQSRLLAARPAATSFARRSIASGPTWGWPSTATATASRWWTTRGWP